MIHNCIFLLINPLIKVYSFTFIHTSVKFLNIISIKFMGSTKVKILETKTVEKEKVIAEKLNGRFAMMGFIALVGAYLTTGQIIPGMV